MVDFVDNWYFFVDRLNLVSIIKGLGKVSFNILTEVTINTT